MFSLVITPAKNVLFSTLFADQTFNVMMHGEVCIPAKLCLDGQTDSTVIHSRISNHLSLLRELNMIDNVNVTCNSTTHTCQSCFYNVTESFLFLEYCEMQISSGEECRSDFCCLQWDEFVSRTCVIVDGKVHCSYTTSL